MSVSTLHGVKLMFIACMHSSVTVSGSEANGRDSTSGFGDLLLRLSCVTD